MAFWDFVKDATTEKKVAKTAFNFLAAPVTNNIQTAKTAFNHLPSPIRTADTFVKDQAVGIARQTARVAPTAVTSVAEIGRKQATQAKTGSIEQLRGLSYDARKQAIQDNPGLKIVLKNRGINVDDPSDENLTKADITVKTKENKPTTFTPGKKVEKIVFGKEPVQSYQQRQAGNEQVVAGSRFRSIAGPLSFLGTVANVAGDVPGVGSTEKAVSETVGKDVIDKLAKTTTEAEAKKLLSKLPDAVATRISPAIARTQDRHVVQRIIDANTPRPEAIVRPPTASKELAKQISDGKIDGQVEKVPINSLQAGIDTEGSKLSKKTVEQYREDVRQGNPIDPLVVSEDNGQLHVQDGKHRLEALKQAGVNDVPIVRQIPSTAEKASLATDISNPRSVVEGVTPPPTDITEATVPKPGGQKQRKFLETVAKSDKTSPELKQGVEAINPQTYTQKSNPELVAKAKSIVDQNHDQALERIRTVENPNDEDVAVGQQLIKKAIKDGRTSDAVGIVEHLDVKLREAGRTVQAASLWDNLSEEGTLLLAQRRVSRAERAAGKGDKVRKTAQEIQGLVEDPGTIEHSDVKQAVQDLSTGEKVAKKVEKQVTPQVKKKADTLVEELTKKIKQESLPAKPGAPKKSSIDVLREVFGRNSEAQDAYPEAQRILRDKFKDNPKALKTLDKFFNSELGLPAASSTIDKALQEQLAKNGEKVSNIIFKSWDAQKQSVEDISKALVSEGFDEQSAKTLATEVHGRLTGLISEAKVRQLERLSKEAPEKGKSVYLDKLNKLSNLGALESQDYLDIAKAKLKLPQLTPEIAKDLSKLSQEVQKFPVDSEERYKVIKQIGEKIAEAAPPPKPSVWRQILGTPKSINASYDISGVGRQGAGVSARFNKEYRDAFKSQVKYFASEDNFNNDMARLAASPRAELMKRAQLALTGIREFGRPEEAFASQLPEQIPLFGKGIQASDRAYTGSLTQLRADVFNHIMDDLEASGKDINSLTDEELKGYGKFINTATGRGAGKEGGWFEKAAPVLGDTLFSPRLWKSRLDQLNPAYYAKLSGGGSANPLGAKNSPRRLALESAASFASLAVSVLGLAAAGGAEVETDPRSSDFGKIKVGDTRYDILGGFQQNIVFAARQITGEKKSSTTGAITKLGGKFGAADRLSVLQDFIQNKESPAISTAQNILKGKDKAGNNINPVSEIGNLLVPLNIQDTYKTFKNTNNPFEALAKATIPGSVGIGVGTYGIKDTKLTDKQAAVVKILEKRGFPKEKQDAYTSFYQTQHQAAGRRDEVSSNINNALKAGDTAKAQKLAADYNKEYASGFKKWAQQSKQYADQYLTKEYNKDRIKLTSASIKTRLKAINSNPVNQLAKE